MPLYENMLVPVCKNVGSRPYSSFGQESCKPYRTVGLYGGPRLPNLEQFFKDRDDGSLSYKKLKVHKKSHTIWNCLLYARLAQLGEHLPWEGRWDAE